MVKNLEDAPLPEHPYRLLYGLPRAFRWAEHQCAASSAESAEATPATRMLSCPGHWPINIRRGKVSPRGRGPAMGLDAKLKGLRKAAEGNRDLFSLSAKTRIL